MRWIAAGRPRARCDRGAGGRRGNCQGGHLRRAAFVLGVSIAALTVVGADTFRPHWQTPHSPLLSAVITLAAGAVAASLALFVPAFGRLFFHGARCEVEVGAVCASAVSAPRAFQDTKSRRDPHCREPMTGSKLRDAVVHAASPSLPSQARSQWPFPGRMASRGSRMSYRSRNTASRSGVMYCG